MVGDAFKFIKKLVSRSSESKQTGFRHLFTYLRGFVRTYIRVSTTLSLCRLSRFVSENRTPNAETKESALPGRLRRRRRRRRCFYSRQDASRARVGQLLLAFSTQSRPVSNNLWCHLLGIKAQTFDFPFRSAFSRTVWSESAERRLKVVVSCTTSPIITHCIICRT